MATILVTVIVKEASLIHFAEIVESCKAAGMKVQRQMTTIGVISGVIEATGMQVLAEIQGVAHVEESRDVGTLGAGSGAPAP